MREPASGSAARRNAPMKACRIVTAPMMVKKAHPEKSGRIFNRLHNMVHTGYPPACTYSGRCVWLCGFNNMGVSYGQAAIAGFWLALLDEKR